MKNYYFLFFLLFASSFFMFSEHVSAQITVVAPGVFELNEDTAIENENCFDIIPVFTTAGFQASTNCPDGIVNESIVFTEPNDGCITFYTYTYTATDNCGNEVVYQAIYQQVSPFNNPVPLDILENYPQFEQNFDNNPDTLLCGEDYPVFTIDDFNETTIYVGGVGNNEFGFTLGEPCGLIFNPSGAAETVNTTTFDDGCWESHYISYVVRDQCTNVRQFTAIYVRPLNPEVAPTISLNPAEFTDGAAATAFTTCDATYPAFTINDFDAESTCSLVVTEDITTETTNDGCTETHTITYTATDECGNVATLDAVFTKPFDNETAPTVSVFPVNFELGTDTTPETLACNDPIPTFLLTDFTADSGCSAFPAIEEIIENSETTDCTETRTYTYTAADNCGNMLSYEAIFIVPLPENVAPTVVAPAAFQMGIVDETPTNLPNCGDTFPTFVEANFTPSDNCGIDNATIDLSFSDATDDGNNCIQTRTYNYIVSDLCGNSTIYTAVYTRLEVDSDVAVVPASFELVADSTPDVLACDAPFPTFDEEEDFSVDACATGIGTGTLTEATTITACTIVKTYTYTATDICGNPKTYEAIFISLKTPVVVTPPDFTSGTVDNNPTILGCGDSFPTFDDTDFNESSDCSIIENVDNAIPITNDGCLQTKTVVYTAINECDDTATYTAEFVLPLTPVTATIIPNTTNCPTQTITVQASGGFACAGGDYTFTLKRTSNNTTIQTQTAVANTNVVFNNIPVGTYYVLVTDNSDGCTDQTTNITIVAPLNGNLTAGCGNTNNTFTLTGLSGGSGTYVVTSNIDGVLSPASTGTYQPTQTLTAATHTITVSDATLDPACALTFTVGVYDVLDIQISSNGCFFDGTVSVDAVSGGNATGYTIYASSTQNGANNIPSTPNTLSGTGNFTGISSTSDFYIVVEDADGCLFSQLVPVSEQTQLTDNYAGCGDGINLVSVTASSIGTSWNFYLYPQGVAFDNGTSAVATNLSSGAGDINGDFAGVAAGTYTVYGQDVNGVCESGSVDVTVYDELTIEAATAACYFTGEVEVTNANGGDGSITVFLSSSQNGTNNIPSTPNTLSGTGTFTGISATTDFYVVIEDSRGCKESVLVPFVPQAELTDATTFDCASPNTANIAASGGNPPFDFYLYENGVAFDNGTSAVATVSGASGNFTAIAGGSYTVYALDADACDALAVDIEIFDELTLEIDLGICAFNGELTVTNIAGGTDPNNTVGGGFANAGYTVFLSTTDAPNGTNNISSNEGTLSGTGSFTGVSSANDFYVILEDANGCQTSQLVSVSEQAILENNLTENCTDNINTVSVSASGGSADWTFYLYAQGAAFDNGTSAVATDAGNGSGSDTQGNFADVAAGTYTVYAIDANDCEAANSINVNVIDELTMEIDFEPCNFNGEIDITAVAGGTQPYTITVSNGSANQASLSGIGTFTSVSVGTFEVVISDANDCEFTIPVAINATGELVSADCLYGNASVSVNNGIANYDFYVYPQATPFDGGTSAVDNSTGGTSANFTDLASGNYTIYATTSDDCEALAIDIAVFEEIVVQEIGDVCDYGTIAVAASGGFSTNYTYSIGGIAPNNATGVFQNIPTGNYTITVTDNNPNASCPVTISVTTLAPINVEMEQICYEGIVVTGGQAPYTFDLFESDGTTLVGSNTTGIFDDTNGAYILTVTDANNCEFTGEITCAVECALQFSNTTTCFDDDSYTVNLTFTSGKGTWIINDGVNAPITGVAIGDVVTTQPIPNGDYTITITNELDDTCSFTASGENDCAPYDCQLNLTENLLCNADGSFSVEISFGGEGAFVVQQTGETPQVGVAAGTYTYGPFAAGDSYDFTVTSQEDATCTETLSNQPYCCLLNSTANVQCFGVDGFLVDFDIDGVGTFTVDDGNGLVLTGVSAGNLTVGPLPNGAYNITITSETDDTCVQTISGEQDCFDCNLAVSASTICTDNFNYDLEITINGSGTFTVDDGINPIQTGVSAGTITVGTFPNGAYNVVVTSEVEGDCAETVSGTEDCFECDLVVNATTTCIDGLSFELSYEIVGSGTFTVDDGINAVQTGVSAGTYTAGTLANGNYAITVTSEVDGTCTETVSGEEDCYECPLEITPTINCLDNFTYEVTFDIVGDGTYSIGDGINPVQTGLTAGSFVIGPFDNGDYNIVITSEVDETCTQTLSGNEDCFECDLVVNATTECVDFFNYTLSYEISGVGTYTVNDGINPVQTGVGAGTYSVGTLPNGAYSIIVTSETDETCTETASGENDCFECELDITPTVVCNDDNLGFTVSYEITGTDTYTVSDINGTETGVIAGTYSVSYSNGNYSIVITSETNVDCTQTLSGNEDCFECDLTVSATTECLDLENYSVTYTIAGTGTFTVDDGINGVETGVTAGTYTIASVPNGSYSITVISETDETCTETASGENDCFECELNILPTIVCNDDNLGFTVSYEITGTDTYTVSDINGTETGVIAGTYSVSYPNGDYSIIITSETNVDCTQTLSGNEDCFECDLTVSATTECLDLETYSLTYTIAGTGTFTVNDGINALQTGVTAGTYTIASVPNGSYSITVISETDETCTETASGENDCFECELEITPTVVCNDDNLGFTVSYEITGTDTYTVLDINGTETGVIAGTYSVSYENGDYSIIITSETNADCTQTLSGNEDCFECDLTVNASTECLDLETYSLTYTIAGTGTFSVDDGINGVETGVIAGTYTIASVPNGSYSITVISETDETCTETASGENDCFECELNITPTIICNDDNLGFTVSYEITGTDTYTVSDINGTQDGLGAGTYSVSYPNGDYSIVLTSETNAECTQTLSGNEDCFECDLTVSATTECLDLEDYSVTYTIAGIGTFSVDDGINGVQTGIVAGTYTIASVSNGAYSIVVTSETDETCTETASGENDCFECELEITPTIVCNDDNLGFTVSYEITGTDTYTVSDINGTQTGIGAGTYSVSYENGNYSIVITSETNADCTQTLSGNEDCFECDLTVNASTECLDLENYSLTYTIAGTGTFTVNDGVNAVQTGVTAGTYTIASVPNGSYSITVISENDETCTETASGENDCFECELDITPTIVCNDDNLGFTVSYEITGTDTYTVSDINGTESGVGAGTYSVSYPNGDYSIIITSETNADCTQTLSGTEDCFECDLVVTPIIECVDLFNYTLSYTIEGTGTFTVDDGINAVQTGVTAGVYDLGTLPNGSYSIIVTSETDETCTQTIAGERDCFECELNVLPSIVCNEDGTGFDISFTLEGNDTYEVTFVGVTQTNVPAGTYTASYPNGDYEIIITSETDPTCTQILSGNQDCFECDLTVTATSNCIDDNTYNVFVNISGTGTFTINDGINAPQTGVSAGNYILGAFPNGDYAVTVTSETDAECFETITGSEDCAPPPICDVTASATTLCLNNDSYEVLLNFTGLGTYTIDDGVNAPLTNQTSATITLGPIPNGTYNITITNEADAECTIQLSGERDCAPDLPCDISAIASTNCINFENYELVVDLGGSSTYTLTAGDNIITGATTGIVSLGTLPNGAYSLTITDEANPECTITLNGNEDCTQDVNCDVEISAEAQCISNQSYVVNITITGTSVYNIDDQQGSVIGPLSAGTYEIGPFTQNTPYQIEVIDENNDLCFKTISGTKVCEADAGCNPGIVIDKQCLEDNSGYQLEVIISGSSTYSLYTNLFADFPNNELLASGLQEGDSFIIGPFNNGEGYLFLMLDDNDENCFQDYIGSFDCEGTCDLEANAFPVCNEDGTSFNVEIELFGSGTYEVSGNANEIVDGNQTLVYGPFNPGDTYYFLFVDINDGNCTQDFLGTADCDTATPCDIDAAIDFSCIDGETYDIIFNLNAEGTYTITASNGTELSGVSALGNPFNLGTFDNGGYSVTIVSDDNADCNASFAGSHICDTPPPCDLVVNNNNECIDNDAYNVVLNIAGSDTYDIYNDGILVQSNVGAGTYAVGPIANGDYNILIQGSEDITCIRTIQGNFSCSNELPCDVAVTVDKECLEEGLYQLNLTITGSGTYTISDGNTIFADAQTAGTITVGPFENGEYDLQVVDNANEDCFQNLNGTYECVACDVAANFVPVCQENGTFVLELTLTGSGTYTIADGVNDDFTNLSAGAYEIGPLPSGLYNITISDENSADCTQNYSGAFTCEPPVCDLVVTSNFECQENESYTITIDINGDSDYTIYDENLNVILENLSAGTYTIDGLTATNYDYFVADNNDAACVATVEGEVDCSNVVCNLSINPQIICNNNGSFYFELNLPEGTTYSINIGGPGNGGLGGPPEFEGVEPGIFETPNFNNETYAFAVIAENIDNCEQEFFGNYECVPTEPECDIALTYSYECLSFIPDASYYFEFTIVGEGTFDVYFTTSGFNCNDISYILEGVPAGVYNLNDQIFGENGCPNEAVLEQLETGCTTTIFATASCTAGCLFEAISDITCNPDGTFFVNVDIQGDDSFDIIDTNTGELLVENVPEGIYSVGPFTDEYDITTYVNGFEECFFQDYNDVFCEVIEQPVCDLDATVSYLCEDDGTYFIQVVIFAGTGVYQFYDGFGGGEPDGIVYGTDLELGTHTFGPFDVTGEQNIYTLAQQGTNDCEKLFYLSPACDPDCDLTAFFVRECNEDGTFNVIVSINGTGTYSILNWPDQNIGLNGLTAGVYTTGPYSSDNFDTPGGYNYDIIVVDDDDPNNCFFNDFGDYTGCDEPNPVCNLFTTISVECNETDGSFFVTFNISGVDEYDITANTQGGGPGGPSIHDFDFETVIGLTAGTYTYGPFFGTGYDFIISGTDYQPGGAGQGPPDGCFQLLSSEIDCVGQPPVCDLDFDYEIVCNNDGSFLVELAITGSDTYEITVGGIDEPVETVDAGSLTVGPYAFEVIDITITTIGNPTCNQNLNALNPCDEDNACDLVVNTDIYCNDDDTYSIDVTINGGGVYDIISTSTGEEGTGFVFEFTSDDWPDEMFWELLNNTTGIVEYNVFPGEYLDPNTTFIETLDGLDPNASYTLILFDTFGDGWAYPQNGDYTITDLATGSLVTSGVFFDGTEFSIELGSPISGGTGNNDIIIANATAGTYTVGPFDINVYNFEVVAQEDANCSQSFNGNYSCGSANCSVKAEYTIECTEDGTGYFVVLEMRGIGSYTVQDGVNPDLTDQVSGTVTVGPIPNGAFSVNIFDPSDPEGCFFSVAGTQNCSQGTPCDLDVSTVFDCTTNGNIVSVAVSIDGSSTYDLDFGDGNSQTNLTSGVYTYEYATTSVNYEITVTDMVENNCSQVLTGFFACEAPPACNISASTTFECADDLTYTTVLNLTGSSIYTITYAGTTLENQIAGIIDLGTFNNGSYTITITDETNPNCSQTLQGNYACSAISFCDLSVEFTPVCEDDGLYFDVEITGSSTYTIFDFNFFGGDNTVITGLTAGSFTVGPISSDFEFYNLQVVDEGDDECFQFLGGSTPCSDFCDLFVGAETECISNTSYNLIVTITGSGTYSISDPLGNSDSGYTEGTYTFGPYTGSNYNISVFEDSGFFCSQFISGTRECTVPNICDLNISATPICDEDQDNAFFLDLTIEGSSSYSVTYNDNTGNNVQIIGLTAGTTLVGPINEGFYFLQVSDETNGDCVDIYQGNYACEEGCNLFVSHNVECSVDDNGYIVTLEVTGSGTYNISDQFGGIFETNIEAGTYEFGPFYLSDYTFQIFDNDGGFFGCSQFITGSYECSLPGSCDLVVGTIPVCNDDDPSNFYLDLTVAGTSSYTVVINGGFGGASTQINNIEAGTTQIGPIAEGFYFIQIIDELNSECQQSLNGNFSCDGFIECDLQANVEVNCLSEEEYELVLNIEGSGNYFVDIDFFNQGQFTAGTYTFGPFDSNGFNFYSLNVYDNSGFFGDCFQSLSGSFSCDPDNPCDIETEIQFVCDEEDNLFIDVVVTGNGAYEIFDSFFGDFQTGGAGTYTFGPYSGDFYGFDVFNSESGCNESYQGAYLCEPQPTCDLFVSVTPECIEETNNYNLEITVQGSEEYVIFGGVFGSEALDTVFAGTYTYGPFTTNSYNIFANSLAGGFFGNCFQQVFGEIECGTTGQACDLNINYAFECEEDNSYSIVLNIAGTGTYTINDGSGTPITGVEVGEITIGPFTTANYSIQVSQEGNPSCAQTASGAYECITPDICNVQVSASTVCNANGTFTLEVVITGDGSLNIDANGEIETGVTAGTYNFGPFNEGDYFVTVANPAIAGCTQIIEGEVQCSPNDECTLDFSIDPICETQGFYTINLIIEGDENFYTVIIDAGEFIGEFEGIAPGEYVLDFIPNGNYAITVESELTDDCFVTYFGTYNCEDDAEPCNLEANATPVCVNATSYNLAVTIEGTGNFDVNYNGNTETVSAGTYTFGPFANGAYEIEIVGGQFCSQTLTGTANCSVAPENCNLFASFELECINETDPVYNVILTITGTGTYMVSGNGFDGIIGATAGVYMLEGLTLDNFNILIEDENIENCFQNLQGLRQCPVAVVPTCNLAANMETICNDDGSVSISVNIEGESTYDVIGANSGFVFEEGISAGTIILGPFNNDNITEFNLIVVDSTDEDCFEAVNGSVNCNDNPEPICNLNTSVVAACLDEESYMLDVTISGTGTYTIQDGTFTDTGIVPSYNFSFTSDNFGDEMSWELRNDETGEVVASAAGFDDNEDYEFEFDNLESGVSYTLFLLDTFGDGWNEAPGGGPNANPDAGEYLITDSAGNIIAEGEFNDGFELQVPLGEVSGLVPNEITGFTAGTTQIGPFANGDYTITIYEAANPDCFTILSGSQDCSEPLPPTCNFEIASSVECESSEAFMVMVDILTEGSYTVSDGVNEPLTNQTAGTITVGPLTPGAYTIVVTDESDEDCIRTITGFNNCPPPVCDLVLNSTVTCINEDSFIVSLDIAGTDTYTITDNFDNVQSGVSAGEILMGPYENGAYNITVTSENIEGCTESVSGIKDCSVPIVCDLAVDYTTTCNEDGEGFVLTLDITGNDAYNIATGTNLITGQTGTVEIPMPNGAFNVVITAVNVEACSYVIAGLEDCSTPIACSIQATSETVCIGDSESYFVSIDLVGENTYTITDGVNSIESAISGQVLFGPLSSATYSLEIIDESNTDCTFTVNGNSDCIAVPVCDLVLETLATDCINDDTFELSFTIAGSGTYAVENTNGEVQNITAGTYVFEIANGNYEYTITDLANAECFETINGFLDCSTDIPCAISANATASCLDNDEYLLTIELIGDSQYSIVANDGSGNLLVNQTAGIIFFGPLTGFNYEITITDEMNPDCAYILTGTAPCATTSISNFVWEDMNQNGLQDDGEPGIADVMVSLFGAGSDGVFDTADDIAITVMTDENGFYNFDNLFAGDYYVEIEIPTNYEPTTQNAGNDGIDSDINTEGITDVITVTLGEANNSVDAGFVSLCADFTVNWIQECGLPGSDSYSIFFIMEGGDAPYAITGDYEGNLANTFIEVVYENGESFNLTVIDDNGCSVTLSETPEDCNPVSIELLEFDGEVLEAGNNLFWSTATEADNDYFTIERSLDGVNFEAIGTVDAIGNSTSIQRYNLLDTEAPEGVAYYRLQMTDIDGKTEFAPNIVKLERRAITAGISVYPNPVADNLTVEFNATAGTQTMLTIYDVAGKLVSQVAHNNTDGTNQIMINMSGYAVGTYLVTILNENEQQAIPVMKH